MSQSLQVQELIIVIAVKQQNPTILTADFLKYTGIVPSDWELARPPVLTNSAAQVAFQNGINIVAEPNRVIFSQDIANIEPQEVQIPAIARKYAETLTQVNYQGVGINFRGLVFDEQENNTTRNYILENLLQPGKFQEFGTAGVKASIRFTYILEETQLYLDINEAELQYPDKKVPAVLFSASFNHGFAQKDQSQLLTAIKKVINNWQADLETYKELINTKFLNQDSYIRTAPTEATQLLIGTI
ncbi:hypothetical protein H6G04_29530 [Calothrix membranacea FACHB-236]|nr:hypothetical protein [Calothrix membranacea FACHB-236]